MQNAGKLSKMNAITNWSLQSEWQWLINHRPYQRLTMRHAC